MTQINFSDRFNDKPNQCYIALAGTPDAMVKHLERVINDIKQHGKPIQENMTGVKIDAQVITPLWNGKQSPYTFIHAKDVEVDEMTDEEREQLENDLIDAAIGRIKKDIEAGDVSAIFELLRFSPVENLIQYLPEDEQTPFKPLVHD